MIVSVLIHRYTLKIKWQTNQTGSVGKMNLNELEPVLEYFEKKLNDSKNSQEIVELIKLSYYSSKNLKSSGSIVFRNIYQISLIQSTSILICFFL